MHFSGEFFILIEATLNNNKINFTKVEKWNNCAGGVSPITIYTSENGVSNVLCERFP